MANLNFPASPSNGQLYTVNNVNYYYNSTAGAWFTDISNEVLFVASVTGTAGQIFSSGGTAPTVNLVSSGVTANTYGGSSSIPVIVVDTFGRITSASNVALAAAGGDISAPYNTANAAYDQANTTAIAANTGFATQTMNVTSLSDSSGTIAWDASTSRMATVTLSGTGRTVSNPTNLRAGSYVLVIKQDAGGSKTITTWGSVFKWPAAVVPTLSTTASTTDVFSFWCDGTNLYGTFIPDCR